ncbi:HNH endonuclease [Paraburkholderia sp. BL9I2N2]|uniref:HNH endonuclease n=1 Tax=Paraburkholderia sp. BL9I2N2 TaxID=1938809 RepID=UPI00104652A6|nr:HNH endonuclease [Paraburkholderia sp. BL9I2N2]TCK87352.1 AP2 domain-containing protein [Paraburkholderia sp. BL9I2N2]
MLTQSELKEIVHYDPDTGAFTWVKSSGNRRAGSRAGSINGTAEGKKYRRVSINKTLYLEHRLAIFWMTGEWPTEQVDHENRIEWDNRWLNIRPAIPEENMCNRRLFSNNKSGIKGVHWSKQQKKWAAQINVRGKQRLLGHFRDLDAATQFIGVIRAMFHGEFACHGG